MHLKECIILKRYFFSKVEGGRESTSIAGSLLKMPVGPKVKPEVQSRSPTWMANTLDMNHPLLSPRVYIGRKLELGGKVSCHIRLI